MGFKEQRSDTFRLVFPPESDFAGLEVICRQKVSTRLYMDIERLTNEKGGMAEVIETFGENVLISWNAIDDDDVPRPPTAEGLAAVSMQMTAQIVMTWINAVAGMPNPLGIASPNGSTSAVHTEATEPA